MQKQALPLSAITAAISDAVDAYFDRQILTVKAEITDVKKYPQKKWCFLKFLEKQGENIVTELKGVFWNTGYAKIASFEQKTGQKFTAGLEVICDVIVKYHPKFGLSLEVVDIDTAHTIGHLEMERQQTINRLVQESAFVRMYQDELASFNQTLQLPNVVKNIALIAPPNSDGLRDFMQEINQNSYGYKYNITVFETQVQGDTAAGQILKSIQKITAEYENYQALAIVRGGGSNTDFKPFDHYEVCDAIAGCPIPVFTGIGHDRNTSIADLVARQLKTPTKVANYFVEHNLNFEQKIDSAYQQLINAVYQKINSYKERLKYIQKTLQHYELQNVLNKGFSIIWKDGKIIDDAEQLAVGDEIMIQTKSHKLFTTIQKKENNG